VRIIHGDQVFGMPYDSLSSYQTLNVYTKEGQM